MTPHIGAKKEEIANTVIMPGDPLRAKYIAENFLEDYRLVSSIRNIYAYTGIYKGKRITVMASGMGNASMGIYSYELFKFYDVKSIIRIGTCGAYSKDLNLMDMILVEKSYSNSSFAKVQNGTVDNTIKSSTNLNNTIKSVANSLDYKMFYGTIYCSDVFYSDNNNFEELYEKYGCLGVEMESFALFHNAKVLGKQASCILTVSDSFVYDGILTPNQRQNSLNNMIKLALESATVHSL